MDLSTVILGPVVTEKAERLKAGARTYVLRVAKGATKIDVQKALARFYGVEVASVRSMRRSAKTRLLARGAVMEKRHPERRVLVTLAPKSKPLDLVSFQTR